MQKASIILKSVKVEDFKPNDGAVKLKINFESNSIGKEIIKEYYLKNAIFLTKSIFLDIRKKDKIIINESDDVLENIFITKIENEDEVEEKLFNFFTKLCETYKKLRGENKAGNYMKIYDGIKISKLELKK